MHTGLDPQMVSEPLPDRRRHPRFRFSAPLTIRCADGRAVPGISIEISESGISVLAADQLTVGDRVELNPVSGVMASALVRRRMGRVYGFEFMNLTAEQAHLIAQKCAVIPRYQGNRLGI